MTETLRREDQTARTDDRLAPTRDEGSQHNQPRRRRFGPGEVGAGWSPHISSSTGAPDATETDREIEMLVRALSELGETSRRDLGDAVGCRYWGPGRFRRALRLGIDQGAITRVRRGVYARGPRASVG